MLWMIVSKGGVWLATEIVSITMQAGRIQAHAERGESVTIIDNLECFALTAGINVKDIQMV